MNIENKTEHKKCFLCGSNVYKKIGNFIFEGITLSLVECKSCGLSFVNPRLTPKMSNTYFQSYTKITPEKIDYYRMDRLNNVLFDIRLLRKERPSGTLLDIGFGYGLFLEYVKKNDWQVCGLEISDHACCYVSKKLNIKIIKGDFLNIPFRENSFDIVTIFDCLYYMHEPMDALKQIKIILKRNGVMLCRIHNRIQYVKLFNMICRDLNRNPFFVKDHIYQFSTGTIKKMLKRCGFDIIAIFNSRTLYFRRKELLYHFMICILFFCDIIRWISFGKLLLAPSITIMAKNINE